MINLTMQSTDHPVTVNADSIIHMEPHESGNGTVIVFADAAGPIFVTETCEAVTAAVDRLYAPK